MYENFYGLSAPPFLLTPDTRFFFSSSNHKRAITHLVYGLDQREGFIVITGEVGAGKTMLVEQLWLQLNRAAYAVSKVVTTQVSNDDLLRLILDGFGLNIVPGTEKSILLRRFETMVREQRAAGRRCVLVVDEVQNLSFPALEELRMLSNLNIDGKASVQTILLGQPQFRPILASRDAEQLRQRVLASFHLGPLPAIETRLYIEHRLKTVGWTGNPSWSEDALAAIHRHTGGTPRRINTLCSRLMQLGALDQRTEITAEMVDQVADEMAEGLNGGMVVAFGKRTSLEEELDTVAIPAFQPPPTGTGPEDILRRLDALEAASARQDRVFQRIVKMLAAVVEKDA